MFQQSQRGDDERSPLLQPYLDDAAFGVGTEGSVAHFYSPIESAHNSDSEDDSQVSSHYVIAQLYKDCSIAYKKINFHQESPLTYE